MRKQFGSPKNPEDAMRDLLKQALAEVRSTNDIEGLNSLRSIFRSEVPFHMRSYVASHFMKLLVTGSGKQTRRDDPRERGRGEPRNGMDRGPSGQARPSDRADRDDRDRNDRKDRNDRSDRSDRKPLEKGVQGDRQRQDAKTDRQKDGVPEADRPKFDPLPEGVETATVFFGAGKKRRFWKAVIVDFIMENAGIPRDKIGSIKLLENYAFVQVASEVADDIISKLDGIEHRGRKISVTWARPKGEGPSRDEQNDEGRDSAGETAQDSGDGAYADDATASDDSAADDFADDSREEETASAEDRPGDGEADGSGY